VAAEDFPARRRIGRGFCREHGSAIPVRIRVIRENPRLSSSPSGAPPALSLHQIFKEPPASSAFCILHSELRTPDSPTPTVHLEVTTAHFVHIPFTYAPISRRNSLPPTTFRPHPPPQVFPGGKEVWTRLVQCGYHW
jgi:hypothetical protein